jgi:hypothetical protein
MFNRVERFSSLPIRSSIIATNRNEVGDDAEQVVGLLAEFDPEAAVEIDILNIGVVRGGPSRKHSANASPRHRRIDERHIAPVGGTGSIRIGTLRKSSSLPSRRMLKLIDWALRSWATSISGRILNSATVESCRGSE